MKRRVALAVAAVLAIAPAAMAGGDHYKCTKATQACLDMMAHDMKNSGWVGIELDKSEDGKMLVKKVVSGSPAESAGFKEGDVLVALQGLKFADESNKEALKAAKKAMAPGKEITYTVLRAGAEKKLTATLAPVPQEVLAQWIGNHMLAHADNTAIARN
ncbi:MAG TPA: PDZ domain-containing protein [Candidatus Polarisedimenticolia bacterium]|nr:PDZ domain-containing protein [Candidatus Polarisedimenticolia bacterium]